MCFLLYCTLNCLRNCACRLACKLACVCNTVNVTYKFAMTKRIPRTLLQRKALKCKPLANCACVVPLIDVQYAFTRGLHAFSLRRRTSYSSRYVACGFVVTSCAFMIHRASRPGRGKPVLISMLACSLCFHAITFEHSIVISCT